MSRITIESPEHPLVQAAITAVRGKKGAERVAAGSAFWQALIAEEREAFYDYTRKLCNELVDIGRVLGSMFGLTLEEVARRLEEVAVEEYERPAYLWGEEQGREE